MQSIKPGRGPSAMNAIGGVVAVIFGIGWTILAVALTKDSPFPVVGTLFPLFGVAFVVMGIVGIILNVRNATGRDRFSIADITSPGEEGDPMEKFLGHQPTMGAAGETGTRLQQLSELRAKGLLSEEEYLAQRKRILEQI